MNLCQAHFKIFLIHSKCMTNINKMRSILNKIQKQKDSQNNWKKMKVILINSRAYNISKKAQSIYQVEMDIKL